MKATAAYTLSCLQRKILFSLSHTISDTRNQILVLTDDLFSINYVLRDSHCVVVITVARQCITEI